MTEDIQQRWIAHFFRRIAALLSDMLILALFGFILGLAFEDTFVQMGQWGRAVGFGIGLAYFGLLNSQLFTGQTLGKKLLGIRVVDENNQTITLSKSILRYTVLALPFYLNGIQVTGESFFSYFNYPLSMIIFGGCFSITYLYIFNRVTRQSLHDLVVGSFVVNANAAKQSVGPIWRPHLAIVAIFFIVAASLPAFTGILAKSASFGGMIKAQSALTQLPDISGVNVLTSTTTYTSINEETTQKTSVTAQVFLSSDNITDSELARRVAIIVTQNYPESTGKDSLIVVLSYGYDIGIWSQWSSFSYDFTPDEIVSVE